MNKKIFIKKIKQLFDEIVSKSMPNYTIFLVKTRHLWSKTRQIFDDVPKRPKRRKMGKIYKLKILV